MTRGERQAVSDLLNGRSRPKHSPPLSILFVQNSAARATHDIQLPTSVSMRYMKDMY